MNQSRVSEDISEVFTPKGLAKIKTGQLLRFDYEGNITEYIITKINRKSSKVWAREVKTYLPEEAKVENNENTNQQATKQHRTNRRCTD